MRNHYEVQLGGRKRCNVSTVELKSTDYIVSKPSLNLSIEVWKLLSPLLFSVIKSVVSNNVKRVRHSCIQNRLLKDRVQRENGGFCTPSMSLQWTFVISNLIPNIGKICPKCVAWAPKNCWAVE